MATLINQNERVGKSLTEMLHYAMAWDEALNGDDIKEIMRVFRKELKELNGER